MYVIIISETLNTTICYFYATINNKYYYLQLLAYYYILFYVVRKNILKQEWLLSQILAQLALLLPIY